MPERPSGPVAPGPDVAAAKRALRARLRAARAALDPEVRATRARALAVQVPSLAAAVRGPVCAYLPVGTEPGSVAWVEALRAAGREVLLPVVPAVPGPLDWAVHTGPEALRPGPLGLREPAGPRLGPGAVGAAGLVLVPALAVDRSGFRLGQGGGYYDRTLPLAAPGAPLVAIVHPEELLDALPTAPFDRPVSAALLAGGGVTPLGNTG